MVSVAAQRGNFPPSDCCFASFFLFPSFPSFVPSFFPSLLPSPHTLLNSPSPPCQNFVPPLIDASMDGGWKAAGALRYSQSFFFDFPPKKNFPREIFAFTRCGGFALYLLRRSFQSKNIKLILHTVLNYNHHFIIINMAHFTLLLIIITLTFCVPR